MGTCWCHCGVLHQDVQRSQCPSWSNIIEHALNGKRWWRFHDSLESRSKKTRGNRTREDHRAHSCRGPKISYFNGSNPDCWCSNGNCYSANGKFGEFGVCYFDDVVNEEALNCPWNQQDVALQHIAAHHERGHGHDRIDCGTSIMLQHIMLRAWAQPEYCVAWRGEKKNECVVS